MLQPEGKTRVAVVSTVANTVAVVGPALAVLCGKHTWLMTANRRTATWTPASKAMVFKARATANLAAIGLLQPEHKKARGG